MDLRILYVELYVSFLLGVFVYVIYELLNVEREKKLEEEAKTANPPRRSAGWSLPPGTITIAIGLFAFCASAAVEVIVLNISTVPVESSIPLAGLVAGLLNPFFFIGVPLGIRWLTRSKRPA
jgi:hypothetical protein